MPTINLGGKHGVEVWGQECGYVRLRFPGSKFEVEHDPANSSVILRSNGTEVRLWSDGRVARLRIWETDFIFHPFIRLPWLRRMIGLR